jgi:hypothetical protein
MCKLLQWHSGFGRERGFNSIYLAKHARAADLVVVGQRRSGPAPACNTRADPSSLVLMAGRPMLIVPPQKDCPSAEHIIIGWKDRREARRAISDSLPLLKRASRSLSSLWIRTANRKALMRSTLIFGIMRSQARRWFVPSRPTRSRRNYSRWRACMPRTSLFAALTGTVGRASWCSAE